MLTTTEDDKLLGPVSGMGQDFITWRRVSIDVYDPYYLVRYTTDDGIASVRQTLFLHFLDELAGVCRQAKDEPRLLINGVGRLAPAHENPNLGWKFDEVDEIWADSQKGHVLKLVMCNGRRVTDGDSEVIDLPKDRAILLWKRDDQIR